MKRRIFSRFGDYGRLVVSSSPKYDGDMISRRIKDGIPKNVFYVNKTLWEAKREQFRDAKMVTVEKGISIPEQLVDEYNSNPDNFKRDLMAIPTGALEGYFKDRELISKAFTLKNQWVGEILKDFVPGNFRWFGHIDLAHKKDSVGIALCYRDDKRIKVPFLVRITAQKGGEINFQSVRDIFIALQKRKFNLVKVTLDGWQSIDTIQQFTARGISSEVLSIDRTLIPYDTLKGIIYNETIDIAKHEILEKELNQLEMIKGKKVDHPRHGSKDVADALAGAVFNCVEDEGDNLDGGTLATVVTIGGGDDD